MLAPILPYIVGIQRYLVPIFRYVVFSLCTDADTGAWCVPGTTVPSYLAPGTFVVVTPEH